MRTKRKVKRLLSGCLAFVSLLTTALSPAASYAAETQEERVPYYEEIKDQLDPDEVVVANDWEVSLGSSFSVESDFSGIEIPDDSKIKVTFQKAENEKGDSFSADHEDTYQAVYYVEPQATAHPVYQVSRNITVREQKKEAKGTDNPSDGTADDSEDEESDSSDDGSIPDAETQEQASMTNPTEISPDHAEALSEEALDAAIEEAENQDTVDEETGLSLGEVLLQAEEQGINIQNLESGESVHFTAASSKARASQSVTITQGEWYYYADYGLGSYLTCPFTVKFGNVTATAYCIQPSKPGPGSGTYQITKLEGNKELAKVCYYGTAASESAYFFNKYHTDFSAGKRFIVTHLAASYANGSSDAFYGTNSTGEALAKELYNYAVSQPDIPDVEMSFSKAKVTAYVDGNQQRTEEVTFKASSQQTITLNLPKGVKLHNVSTGKTSAAGAEVTISGGTRFYLTAPLTQTKDVSGSWSAKMQGSITKDYSAYKITTDGESQDLALVFGEGVEDEKYVTFSVKWLELAKVEVIKVDSNHSDAKLAGAVFGIYSDKGCTNLITKMPATDKSSSEAEIIKTQNTVYLKEITAPKGYRLNTSSYNVNLVANQTTSVTVSDQEQLGELIVYKEGEVLAGADVNGDGVKFLYESRRQADAVYNVYAGADIVTAYGAKVYEKGDLVKANLTTDSNGAAVLKNLHLGTYVIREVQAPENFYNAGEEKTVTLSYAGQNVETVFSESTFHNDRQKAEVSVVKEDKDTRNPLDGGIFGLYAGSDILNADGEAVVSKGTLIGKAVTGEDGKAVFTADLPIGFRYEVKEIQAPSGYVRNTEDVYSFTFEYTNDNEAKVGFTHTFSNERVNAKIMLQKKDKETNQALPQGDASLEKAVYGLYAREDIVHPDGKTGVIYKAGERVASLTTDKEGKAAVEQLYLGKYYIKEITPPIGYLADENEYDLSCDYEGDLTATVERKALSMT